MKKERKLKKPLGETDATEASDNQEAPAPELAAVSDAPSAAQAGTSPEMRTNEREAIELKTIVQVKNSEGTWKDTATVHSVSRSGCGFNISKPCAVGRLATLVMPLPVSMRAYDFHERLYPVMALVQYCHEVTIDGEKSYNVGAAFIGNKIPPSYTANPDQSYRIRGMGGDGLWQIAESQDEFQVRKHSRFWVEVEVSVTILQKDKKAVCKDVSTTQDISAGGASMRSAVAANIGDKVKFTCKKYNFFSMAVVRGRSVDGGDHPTLHLEFLDAKFPVHKLPKPETQAAPAEAVAPVAAAGAAGFAVERF